MPEQQVIWTALPRAADDDHLYLDVFVSPRLGLNAPVDAYTLADFPELEHWTKTVEDHLAFEVELADGTRHAADVLPAALDHDAWDHLFPSTTFVRPWSFRDLSDVPIYSFPVRFVTAYLRDLYRNVGQSHPARPPSRADLDEFREDLGPVTDVRVPEERRPPPRDPEDLPLPPERPRPRPDEPAGCLPGFLLTLWRLLVAWLRKQLHLPPRTPPPQPPPDPTPDPDPVPRVVHPSPYEAKPPLAPVTSSVLASLEAQMAADKVISPSPSLGDMGAALAARDPTFDFVRAQRFFDRPESATPVAARPEPPELDFHQALGALGDYPALMRVLGLVVRLRLPRPAADPGSVRVLAKWDGVARAGDVAPRTQCTLAGDSFAAATRPPIPTRPSELAGGMLDLSGAGDRLSQDTPKFDIVQVDSDGAALKAILAAATLERQWQLLIEKLLGIDLPDEQGTPALRSGGLAIVRPDRAYHVHGRLSAAASLVVAQPAPQPDLPGVLPDDLYAEDLLRGYRVEVAEGGGEWRSLCWRVGTYRLVDDLGAELPPLLTVADEGYVKSTSAASKGPGKPLYVHEALARWTGWSLTVPRPGRTLANDVDGSSPPGDAYERPEWPRNEPGQDFRLKVDFEPKPGTLPRLRFGGSYRMRARAVDLAGELLAAPTASDAASDPVVYRRFEPAGPPATLALRAFWPGESLERVVVRSDFDRDSATYDQQALGAGATDAVAHRTRYLFPPKTSQQMAELHGKLDAAFGPAGDPATGYRIALRESGTFADEKIFDVQTVDIDDPQATIPFGDPEVVAGDALDPEQPGTYVINAANETLLSPYLPDPLVAGIALRGVPGLVDHVDGDPLTVLDVQAGETPAETEPLLQVPHFGVWPDLESLRLRVAEQTGATKQPPHWDASSRVLTVRLPKAGRAEIRYSSYVSASGLDAHGIWDWIDDDDPAGALRSQAEHGAHWMISPPRVLTLVHAVQRPLRTAHFPTLDVAARAVGQTTAELVGQLELDVASTSRIDVIGSWTEWLDDPDAGVVTEPRESVAFDLAVDESWTDSLAFPPPPADPTAVVRTRHEFADTRHRVVDYAVRATTRFREYLPPSLLTTQLTRDSAPAEIAQVNVLSSARPPAPRILYAVPTFDWPTPVPAPGWAALDHRRGGGGLRIYVDRPWYASGEGELLGVVMTAGEPNTLPDNLRSRYGRDPTNRGAPAPSAQNLEPQHFPNRVTDESGLPLAEDGTLTATVAGFEPRWDDARKLWFFDLELAVDQLGWTYWPFVRLALCRYQPDAIAEAKLSRIAIGEFAQVAPDRRLSLSWIDDSHVKAVLQGMAPLRPHQPRVAFRVQTTAVAAGAEPDELDWEHAAGPAPTVDPGSLSALVGPDDPDNDGDVTWETVVALPSPRGTKRMRLEVAEYEALRSDEEIGNGQVVRMTYAVHVALD